jgi:hypothetical protein
MRTVIELLCNRLDLIDLSEVISPPGMSCLKQVRDKAYVAIPSPDNRQSGPSSGKHLGLIVVLGEGAGTSFIQCLFAVKFPFIPLLSSWYSSCAAL